MHKEKNQFLKQNKQCEELCKKIISLDMLATIENPAKKNVKMVQYKMYSFSIHCS